MCTNRDLPRLKIFVTSTDIYLLHEPFSTSFFHTAGPKFPTFEHPTPINVSIRPIGQTTSSITVVSPPKKNEVSRPAGTFIPPAAQPPRITGPGGMVGPPPGARYAAVDNGQQPPGANGLRPGVPGAPGSVLLPTGTPSSDTGRCCTVS